MRTSVASSVSLKTPGGSFLVTFTAAEKVAIAQALHQNVWPLIEKGQVQPVIYATFALKEASEAHQLMETSAHIGKIVLTS